MAARDMPAAEVDVDEELVRALLAEQHPDLAGAPLEQVAFGWDNVLFRLGAEFAVRLPRRELGAALVEHEQRWLPQLAPRLPLPVPTPVRVGVPGCGYPWRWSICPWLPGVPALARPPADAGTAARTLGAFAAAMHAAAPHDAPRNPYRGGPLVSRDDSVRAWLALGLADVDAAAVTDLWESSLGVEPWAGPPMWIHGDLHPGNILVDRGDVSAVIDFGDMAAGDPATDLALGWMLFEPPERAVFREHALVPDDATWQRGRGWALLLGMAMAANSADNPAFSGLGHRTITGALAG